METVSAMVFREVGKFCSRVEEHSWKIRYEGGKKSPPESSPRESKQGSRAAATSSDLHFATMSTHCTQIGGAGVHNIPEV